MTAINQQIGKQLRKHRKLTGLSQVEVAKKLHLKSSAIISRWERGITQPSLDNALRLSALYKTLVNELFWDLFTQYRDELFSDEEKHKGHDP